MKQSALITTFIVMIAITFAMPAAAQNSLKLFDASLIGQGDAIILAADNPTLVTASTMVATNSVVLSCNTGGWARLGGDLFGGPLFIDNFFKVTTTTASNAKSERAYTCSYEQNSRGCFSGFEGNWQDPSVVGENAVEHYSRVDAVPVSVAPGIQLLTFDLLDAGGIYGNSDLFILTSCAIPSTVTICHKPGTPAQKTMTLPNAAIAGHIGHGDTLGACTSGK